MVGGWFHFQSELDTAPCESSHCIPTTAGLNQVRVHSVYQILVLFCRATPSSPPTCPVSMCFLTLCPAVKPRTPHPQHLAIDGKHSFLPFSFSAFRSHCPSQAPGSSQGTRAPDGSLETWVSVPAGPPAQQSHFPPCSNHCAGATDHRKGL